MIRSYTDHAANERTFLAWLRTGVAVIAFGFLMERFDLFIRTMADATSVEAVRRLQPKGLSHSLGAGRSFMLVGIAFILVATVRFVRTGWLLDDPKIHETGIVTDLSLSVILAILLLFVSVPSFFTEGSARAWEAIRLSKPSRKDRNRRGRDSRPGRRDWSRSNG